MTLATGTAQAVQVEYVGGAGLVEAWGDNENHQSTVPPWLQSHPAVAVAGGAHYSIALTTDGQVVEWGNDNEDSATPQFPVSQAVTAIAAGGFHSLALTPSGQVVAWGVNLDGQTDVPADLSGRMVTAVAAGGHHSLALTSDGQVVAWGDNTNGQAMPPDELIGRSVTEIAAGTSHSLALTSDGTVAAWGYNRSGQTSVPAELAGRTVTAIAAGSAHSLALTSDGQVVAWGDNSLGQTTLPIALQGRKVIAISAGGFHSLALTDDAELIGWGSDTPDQPTDPTPLAGQRVIAFAAGYLHSLAVVEQGPPAITEQPNSQALAAGSTATFTVSATGAPAPTIQWQRAEPGSDTFGSIFGATGTSYTTGALTTADDGARYRVVAANETGTATSEPATLTVGIRPTISGTPPPGLVGTGYTFQYVLDGTPTPSAAVSSGSLPPGLALSPGGVLSGSPTTAGSYTFTVGARNTVGGTSTISTVTISAASTTSKANLKITMKAPSTAKVGQPFTYDISVTNMGPAAASNVVTTLALPKDLLVRSTGGNPVLSGGRIAQYATLSTPNVASGATVTYQVTVTSSSKGIKLAVGGTSSLVTPDPAIANNIGASSTVIK